MNGDSFDTNVNQLLKIFNFLQKNPDVDITLISNTIEHQSVHEFFIAPIAQDTVPKPLLRFHP